MATELTPERAQFIRDLIVTIDTTTTPESVTNEMVAAVLDWLDKNQVALDSKIDTLVAGITDAVAQMATRFDGIDDRFVAEVAARAAADSALSGRIDSVEAANTNQDTAIQYLREQNTAKGERLDTLESDLEGLTEYVDAINDSLGELEGADAQLSQRIDDIGAQVNGIAAGLGVETDTRTRQVAALEQSKLDKSAIVVLSESEYEALGDAVDDDKYYFITEDE